MSTLIHQLYAEHIELAELILNSGAGGIQRQKCINFCDNWSSIEEEYGLQGREGGDKRSCGKQNRRANNQIRVKSIGSYKIVAQNEKTGKPYNICAKNNIANGV